ncbi:hypothetical protein EJB05_28417, partial [Eragrostis curvula]
MVSPFIEKYRSQKNIEENLCKLRQLLTTIHGALEAAEGQAISNSWLLRWIRNLEDAACQGGRVLREWKHRSDEVSYALENSSNTFKRIKVATAQFLSCKEAIIRIDDTVKKIEIVAASTSQFIELLKFECSQTVVHRPIIVSVSMHARIIGRIQEKKQVIDFLLKAPVSQISRMYIEKIGKRGSASDLYVIPSGYVLIIWGPKGVGKSTLAQLVCKDQMVKNHFSLVIWMCCREYCSKLDIVGMLCKKLDCASYTDMDISLTVNMIAERIRTERFLLVLDGLCSYPSEMNDILFILLGRSRPGSKVIITTMYRQFASRMYWSSSLSVRFLPMEDLGCLFIENALGGAHPEEYRKLLLIGKEIAETLWKCSPLAAKVVSGLLHDNLNEKYWYSVLSCCRQLVSPRYKVTIFMQSYKLLPAHLERCFGVFGTYPRWTFTRGDLISQWVHSGVVGNSGGRNSAENVAADCFDDLLRKAFIQPSQVPGLYIVDDMLRDVALHIGPMPLPKPRMQNSTNNKRYQVSRLIDRTLLQVLWERRLLA